MRVSFLLTYQHGPKQRVAACLNPTTSAPKSACASFPAETRRRANQGPNNIQHMRLSPCYPGAKWQQGGNQEAATYVTKSSSATSPPISDDPIPHTAHLPGQFTSSAAALGTSKSGMVACSKSEAARRSWPAQELCSFA